MPGLSLPRRSSAPDLLSTRAVASSFSASWLRGDPRALGFLPDRFRHRTARAEAVAAAGSRSLAPALHDALVARNARLAPSPARERNLELLARPGTAAVVTGQQVGLFLGPLFTVYKAASAIVAARALTEETGRPCVPVFWLQTEDHDLPEIDHCSCPAPAGAPLRVALELPDAATSRVPVGPRRLGESVTAALAALRAELGSQRPRRRAPGAARARRIARARRWRSAFAGVLSALFADEGLVFLDPRRSTTRAAGRTTPPPCPRGGHGHRQRARPAGQCPRRGGLLRAGPPPSRRAARLLLARRCRGPALPARIPRTPRATWSLVGHPDGRLRDDGRAARLARPRAAALHDLGAAAPAPAGHLAAHGGVRRRARGDRLLRAARAALCAPGPPHAARRASRARFRVLDDQHAPPARQAGPLAGRGDCAARRAAGPPRRPPGRGRLRAARGGRGPPHGHRSAPSSPASASEWRLVDPGFARAVSRTDRTVRVAVSKLVAKYGRALARRDQVHESSAWTACGASSFRTARPRSASTACRTTRAASGAARSRASSSKPASPSPAT